VLSPAIRASVSPLKLAVNVVSPASLLNVSTDNPELKFWSPATLEEASAEIAELKAEFKEPSADSARTISVEIDVLNLPSIDVSLDAVRVSSLDNLPSNETSTELIAAKSATKFAMSVWVNPDGLVMTALVNIKSDWRFNIILVLLSFAIIGFLFVYCLFIVYSLFFITYK
jgi:Ca2+-dependent lipid-binding protein